MSLFLYVTFKERFFSDDLGCYTSFGIKAIDTSNNDVLTVSDVSVNEAFVNELCRSFNLYQLDPIHLSDALDDAVG